MTKISEPKAKQILGVGGLNTTNGTFKADEFLTELKGKKSIDKFREMRDNDATVGAVMYATEQVLRDVPYKVEPVDESEGAKKEAEFVESVLKDMEHSLDDHISESLSSLTFGFSVFEVVYKRRVGPTQTDPKKASKYTDGRLGIRKLASRAQWTIDRFKMDKKTGECEGIYQKQGYPSRDTDGFIPASKLLHYRTTNVNNDPSGRSILRNAYKSYTYLTNLQSIEAIAIEREMHGIPVGRMPAEYLDPDATDAQKSIKTQFEAVLSGLKANEYSYALLPSDLYVDVEGKPTDQRLMDITLITADGNRAIDIDPVIKRYQHDIARSIMAEFLMLGSGSQGSYALSKSKTDLYLRSVESYINSIFDVLNKQLLEPLWRLNGLDFDLMPKIIPGDVAPHDLKELGAYLRNLNGANIDLADQIPIVNALLETAELPHVEEEIYMESRELARNMDRARADYYDDDRTPGKQGEEIDEKDEKEENEE